MGASTRALQSFFVFQDKDDETLPNFTKKKHLEKRNKKNKG
jgi:hypothetical protein